MTTVGDLGELGLIRRLARSLPAGRDVATGIGDDAAVVSPPGADHDLLLTSDAVIETVHFSAGDAPERIGRKAAGRILSDLAAMGGEARWCLVDVAAPSAEEAERIEGIYRGLGRAAERFGMGIVGGDVARGEALELHLFGVGTVPRGCAVLRSGARVGDLLYVTGSLGGSRAGRHLDIEPRLAEGRWLREGAWARAMIDLSDGLATDARHLAEAGGAALELTLDAVPVAEAALAAADGTSGLVHALADGEDHELLFAVPGERADAFDRAWKEAFDLPCTRIGTVADGPPEVYGIDAQGHRTPLAERGWEHFRERR